MLCLVPTRPFPAVRQARGTPIQFGNKVLSYSIAPSLTHVRNEQRGILSMKRLIFALCAALLVSTLGPLPSVSARDWWWHHHSNQNASGVGTNSKTKQTKTHREGRSRGNTEPLYTSPRSVGWWHKGPGPMGAGSGSKEQTKTARHERHHKEKSAQASNGHSHFAWLHRHHDSNAEAAGSGGGSK